MILMHVYNALTSKSAPPPTQTHSHARTYPVKSARDINVIISYLRTIS